MRVLFVTQFSEIGGSSRIQVLQFLPLLRKAGIECKALYLYSDRFYRVQNGLDKVSKIPKNFNFFYTLFVVMLKRIYVVFSAWKYDAILIQRDTFPKLLYWFLRKVNPRVIYEIEDTIYEINTFWERGFLHRLLLRYQARLCLNMMEGAYAVVAENDYHAITARKYSQRVYLLSAPIDVEKFVPCSRKEGDAVTIGWIGSPSTTYLLESLKPVLREVYRRFPAILFRVVGASPSFEFPDFPLVKEDWSLDRELSLLQSFDIGLMPLDETPFNRGRLGYKMIQYLSVGIPIVASDFGLNRIVVKNGENGFLVKIDKDWVDKLLLLIADSGLRDRLGRNGRRMAEEQFSLTEKSKIYLEIFNQLWKP